MKSVRYSLIYKFFAAQIRFGYYKTGDCLPPIEELTKIYHASSRTVQSAYTQLQQDGYIRLSAGRRTTVVYETTEAACIRNCRTYYLARRDAILALRETLQLLFTPLMREGCRRLGPPEMRQIKKMAAKLGSGDFYVSYFCGRAMFLALKNRLALYLFNDVVSFYQFPHTLLRRWGATVDKQHLQALSEDLVAACDRQDQEALFRVYMEVQNLMDRILCLYIPYVETFIPVPEQIPFEWKVYRDHPQLCYSVAAQLIDQILLEQAYRPGATLPSYGALAETYQVSFSTIRRTMDLLEKLGVVATSRGAGTRVPEPAQDPDRLQHGIVQGILKAFREVLQILCISFDALAERASLQAEERDACSARLHRLDDGAGPAALLLCMRYLLHGQAGFQGIGDKLYEALLLGLPLLGGQTAGAAVRPLARSLEANDAPAFSALLKALLLQTAQAADQLALP